MNVDLIIPAFNEQESVGLVVAHMRPHVRYVIVVDNASTDQTAIVAQKAGAIVCHQPEKGYGAACLTGIAHIAKLSSLPDAVLFADADLADDPKDIEQMIHLYQQGYQLVIASRVLGKREKGALTTPQRFGNWLATRLIALFFRTKFTDLGPFRLIGWQTLLALEMKDRNFGWTVEMQVKAAKKKIPCTEIPTFYRKRKFGKSKVSRTLKGVFLAGHKILWTIFKHL